jgi:hypothetical protein
MHEVNAMRSRFQTAALHAARREAQQFDDVEVIPTHTQAPNKRVTPGRTSQPLAEQPAPSRQARSSSDLSQQQIAHSNGSQRTLDATSGQQKSARHTLSSGELQSTNKPPRTDSLHMDDLQSDKFRVRSLYPETESLLVNPQTSQMERSPQLGRPQRNSDMMTGNLKTPLVRRAPYLYEDDPLRQELVQQIDEGPIVRRSSRHLHSEDAD